MKRPAFGRQVACILAAVAMCAVVDRAQDDGPIILGQQQKHEMIHFDPPEMKLLLNGLYSRSSFDDTLSKSKTQEYRFDQLFSMATDAYFVDPSVVDLHLAGAFGLMERYIDSDGSTDNQIGELYEYDTRITLFEPRELSWTAYARQDRSVIDRTFGPSIDNTTRDLGTALDYRTSEYTSHLEVFQATSEQRSPGDPRGDFDFTEFSVLWNNHWQINDRQSLTWDYVYDDADQTATDFRSQTQRHDGRIEHEWHFGQNKQHRLVSTVHMLDQSGNFAQQYVRWEERLRLEHSKTFETNYRYLMDYRSTDSYDQTRQRETAGFTHRLYKSLITTGQIGAEQVAAGNGPGTNEYFGTLDFDYRKQVPLGLFTGGLGIGLDRQETAEGATRAPVIDLPFFVPADQAPIVIIDPQLRPGSIVITDPSGLRIYCQGVDYDLIEDGERAEIRPILGGPLTPGTVVVIDWAFDPQPASTTDTTTLKLRARYSIECGSLRGLSVYGSYTRQDQNVDSDAADQFLDNSFQDTLVGTEYRIADYTFTAERQWRTGGIYPFDATRFSAKWDHALGFDAKVLLNTSYMIFDYPEEENHVDLWTVSGQYQHRIDRNLYLIASALWRNETDDRYGDSTGFEQQIELTWKYRQIDFFLRARNSMLDTDRRSDSSYQDVQIGFERRF